MTGKKDTTYRDRGADPGSSEYESAMLVDESGWDLHEERQQALPFNARPALLKSSKPKTEPLAGTIGAEAVLRQKYENASKSIPKYLFRMWSPTSGGSAALNSKTKIMTPAFYYGKGHESSYGLRVLDFQAQIDAHLYGDSHPLSGFSSWSQSLQFVFHYAEGRPASHISIIDTDRLRGKNTIFYVPELGYRAFHKEYLAHGIIEGDAHVAVSFASLKQLGLGKLMSTVGGRILSKDVRSISPKEVGNLMAIASAYGPHFKTAMTIALICMTRRSKSLSSEITSYELNMILDVLGKDNIPDWSGSRGVINDVYNPIYEDCQKMVRLMRALYARCYGRGARLQARAVNGLPIVEE